MTAFFLTGFDSGGIENAKSSAGTFSVQNTVTNHNIGYSLRVNPTTSATGYVGFGTIAATTGKPAFLPIQSYFTRFYFRVATLPASGSEQILSANTTAAAQNWALRITSTGAFAVYNASNVLVDTSSFTVSLNTWYLIDIAAANNGTGAWLLDVDGVNRLNESFAQGASFGEMSFGKRTNRSSQTMDVYYDDIFIDDSASPGAGRVACLQMQNVSVSYDFVGGTNGATPNNGIAMSQVNDAPLNTTTYVLSAASATHDATFNPYSPNQADTWVSAPISGVLLTAAGISEDVSGTSNIQAQIKSSSSTAKNSTALNSTTTPENLAVLTTNDPNGGGAWTTAAIHAASFGIILGGTNAIAVRLSAVFVEVAGVYQVTASPSNPASIAITAPTGAATGSATASPTGPTITVTAPTGSATGDALASSVGPAITTTITDPSVSGDALASPTGPTIAITVTDPGVTGDALASPTGPTVTITAPTGSATGDALASPVGPTITISITGGSASGTDGSGGGGTVTATGSGSDHAQTGNGTARQFRPGGRRGHLFRHIPVRLWEPRQEPTPAGVDTIKVNGKSKAARCVGQGHGRVLAPPAMPAPTTFYLGRRYPAPAAPEPAPAAPVAIVTPSRPMPRRHRANGASVAPVATAIGHAAINDKLPRQRQARATVINTLISLAVLDGIDELELIYEQS